MFASDSNTLPAQKGGVNQSSDQNIRCAEFKGGNESDSQSLRWWWRKSRDSNMMIGNYDNYYHVDNGLGRSCFSYCLSCPFYYSFILRLQLLLIWYTLYSYLIPSLLSFFQSVMWGEKIRGRDGFFHLVSAIVSSIISISFQDHITYIIVNKKAIWYNIRTNMSGTHAISLTQKKDYSSQGAILSDALLLRFL